MSNKDLDHPDIGCLLQYMVRPKLWSRVCRGHRLPSSDIGRGIAGAPELARRHRVDRVHPVKQPPVWAAALYRRATARAVAGKHPGALALFDTDTMRLLVDVWIPQRDTFGHSQTAPRPTILQSHLYLSPGADIETNGALFRAREAALRGDESARPKRDFCKRTAVSRRFG